MSMEITKFNLSPSSFEEAMKYSELICQSSFCPTQFKGKKADVLIAIQMGNELGLAPIQALQNIAVINGKPSIYGDVMLGLIKAHHSFEYIEESIENDIAICKMKRKGEPEAKASFSVEDAKRAGLWGKSGPWSTYPQRMLQMRARGFACRDVFPDVLKGLISAEEAQDYPTIKEQVVNPKPIGRTGQGITHQIDASSGWEISKIAQEDIDDIKSANNMDDLKDVFAKMYKKYFQHPELIKELITAKDTRKEILEKLQEEAEDFVRQLTNVERNDAVDE